MSFTQALKKVMLTRAGLPPGNAIEYELDHFVPLAVGGHPRSEDNLWLQRWDGAWNARVKDHLERRLQVMVCAGEINLHTARTAIQNNCTRPIASTWSPTLQPFREAWRQKKRKSLNDRPGPLTRGASTFGKDRHELGQKELAPNARTRCRATSSITSDRVPGLRSTRPISPAGGRRSTAR